jgi:hypothetical protein
MTVWCADQIVIHTEWQIPSVTQIVISPDDGHIVARNTYRNYLQTRQSSTKNDKYQVSLRYSFLLMMGKHVQKRNKHTKEKKNVHQVGFIYKTKVFLNFFWSRQCCASWVCSSGSNSKQGILFISTAVSPRCSTPRVTRQVVIKVTARPPRQCTSTVVSGWATFLSQTQNPKSAATSIFAWPCTVKLFFICQDKTYQKPTRNEDAEIIKQNTMQQLMLISKTDFHKCLEQ